MFINADIFVQYQRIMSTALPRYFAFNYRPTSSQADGNEDLLAVIKVVLIVLAGAFSNFLEVTCVVELSPVTHRCISTVDMQETLKS